MNMNLKKIINYFTENAEDSDNVRSISISMDAMSIRKAMNKEPEPIKQEQQLASEEPSAKTEKPTDEQTT